MRKAILRRLLLSGAIISLFAAPLSATEEYYTVQAGSYPSITEAEKCYKDLIGSLTEEQRDHLRIELVKGYYTVRVGRFDQIKPARKLLESVRKGYGSALILKAYIKEERIKKIYRREAAAEARPEEPVQPAPEVAVAETPLKEAAPAEETAPLKPPEGPAIPPAPVTKKEAPEEPGIKKKEEAAARRGEAPEEGWGVGFPIVILAVLFLLVLVGATHRRITSFLGERRLPWFIGLNRWNETYPLYPDMVQDIDPRYAARNLREKFSSIIEEADINKLPAQVKTDLLKESSLSIHETLESVGGKLSSPTAVLGDLTLSDGFRLLTEAYVKGDVEIGDAVTIRSLAADGEIRTGKRLRVLRWMDSEKNVTIEEESNLGMSVTAEEVLLLSRGCLFKVIYGKPVRTYSYSKETDTGEPDEDIVLLSLEDMDVPIKPLKNRIWFTKEELIIPSGVRVFKNLVTTSNLTVRSTSVIHGYLKAHKNIFIQDNVIVKGDVTAYNDLYIGKNVHVEGTIYSRGRTYLDRGVRIGKAEETVSLFSLRSIEICEDVEIFGLAFTKGVGRII